MTDRIDGPGGPDDPDDGEPRNDSVESGSEAGGFDRDEVADIGATLAEHGVEYVGELSEGDLGELPSPDTSPESSDDPSDIGATLKEHGVEYVGGVSDDELGNLSPPDTPPVEEPEQ